jgi:diacylglycerol kinase family enzyme
MQQANQPTNELTLAVVPVGTGNDWIKTHQIANKPEEALRLIADGNTRLHDIGLCRYTHAGQTQERYFLNVAGFGYDAYVTKASNELRNPVSNKIFYLYLIMKCMFSYRSVPCRVELDGQATEADYYVMNAGICIYNGGGVQMVPHAVPDDGLLAYTLIRDVTRRDVILSTPAFYNGKVIHHPKATHGQCRVMRITALDPTQMVLAEVDGEFLGGSPLEVEVREKALQVIVPR